MADDDDDFREFLKLDKQYFEAAKEERDGLQPDFDRAINKAVPGLLEKADIRSFNGDYLRDMVDQCVKRGLARPDLTPYGRINLNEDADAFAAFFEVFRNSVHPKFAAMIYAAMTAALFIGMRSGHDPDAAEKLRRRAVRDSALNAANTPKRKTPRGAHANELVSEIVKENPGFNNEEIVEEIPNRWRRDGVPCFTPNWLRELVRRWRRDKDIPQPMHRQRRTFPLRRVRRF